MARRNPEEQPVVHDIDNPVNFGAPRQSMTGPVVAAGVTDPAALRYAAAAGGRRGQRYATPVAGGPSPSIPRLDAAAAKDMTMADQAAVQRASEEGAAQPALPQPKGGLFQGGPMPKIVAPPPKPAQPPPILHSDILPDEALQDPDFKQGGGSRYAASQPGLALKYGVIRGGKRVPPQQLSASPKGLRQETLADLATIQDAQKVREKVESGDTAVEKAAAAGAAGAAGRLGNAPTEGPETRPALTEKQAVEALKKMDDFDFSTFREMMMKDIINNDDQKKIIEARCKPLDVTDLIVQGYVTQRVPIVPGKFEPEYQSMRGDEDLAIKRLIMLESKGIEVTERYLLDKFSLMGVTIGLRSINGTILPNHLDENDNFNEELFLRKFNFVAKLPFHMLGSIGVNYYWFDIRVRKLFVADTMGNG